MRGHLEELRHGNSEIHSRPHKLMEKRIFPADINRVSTRKEELLLDDYQLQSRLVLRQLLHPLNVIDSMEFLLDKISRTKTNKEFLELDGGSSLGLTECDSSPREGSEVG